MMTRRTQTHITDTLAIREILSKVPENWLVRGLEERDYGIDLSIEKYNDEKPTGSFSLIQVKGTRSEFDQNIVLNGFPTKTLEYAQLFPEAFFIFYTSIVSKKTYFVWAQKYVEIKLSVETPQWKEQETNTIYFPVENVLGSEKGNSKIEKAMDVLSAQRSGLNYLADLEALKLHWEGYKCGNPDAINACINLAKSLINHKAFYNVYQQFFYDKESSFELLNLLEEILLKPIIDLHHLTANDCQRLNSIEMQLSQFDTVKSSFLNQKEFDTIQVEMTNDAPY